MRYLLDTTVLIDALRGRPAAQRIAQLRGIGEVPFVSAINIEEVVRGALLEEREATMKLLRSFRIAPISYREGVRAGRWRRGFAQSGVTLSQADCLIAAAAVTVGAQLATGNPRDFPMPEVTVDHWEVGA